MSGSRPPSSRSTSCGSRASSFGSTAATNVPPPPPAPRLQVAGLGEHAQRLAHRRARERQQLRQVALGRQALARPQQADLDRAADALDRLLERVRRPDRREDRVLVAGRAARRGRAAMRERYRLLTSSRRAIGIARRPSGSKRGSTRMSTAVTTELAPPVRAGRRGRRRERGLRRDPRARGLLGGRAARRRRRDASAAPPQGREAPLAGDARRATCPTPELAPDEVLVAVMASCDELQHRLVGDLRARADVRVPAPLRQGARLLGQAARPAVPRRRLGRLRRRAAHGLGRQPSWKPGDRVLVHPNDVALEEPQGHDDAIQDPDQRVWGFESQLRRAGRAVRREGRPADAEAGAPDLGRGGLHAARQLHGLPHAGVAERRADAAGRRRADLGRLRRAGRLRAAVRAQRRRLPRVRRLVAGEGAEVPRRGRGVGHRPRRARASASGTRTGGRTRRSSCAWASASAS